MFNDRSGERRVERRAPDNSERSERTSGVNDDGEELLESELSNGWISDISRRTNEKFVLNKQQRITENLPLLTMPISLSICLSICLSDCLSVCLSVCLLACLSACLSGRLPACLLSISRAFVSAVSPKPSATCPSYPYYRTMRFFFFFLFLNFSFICSLFVPRQPLLDDF